MRSASDQPSSTSQRASFRQRAAAFAVAIAVQVVLIVMLLGLAPSPMRLFEPEKPNIFQLLPEPRTPSERGKTKARVLAQMGGAQRRAPKPPVRPAEPTPAPPLALIPLTRSEFAASDIAALPSHQSAAAPTSGSGTGTGRSNGEGSGTGEGPGGEQLYNAEWYREPTHAELAYYLPKNASISGWGMIACRTIENFQVDDCQELGDSPMGSGLARAIRQAAWQFRVRPPRVNGRPLVGSWVRIRIDFTEGVGSRHF